MGVLVNDIQETTTVVTGTVDTTKAGTYVLTYVVTDKSGNKTEIVRYVTVSEKTDIQFTLGEAKTSIYVKEKYVDGTCTVNVNGENYKCDVKSSNVDTSKPGVYTITYSYTHNDTEYTYKRYVFVLNKSDSLLTTYYRKEEECELI